MNIQTKASDLGSFFSGDLTGAFFAVTPGEAQTVFREEVIGAVK